MSTDFSLNKLRQILKDTDGGLEQMVTLIPFFSIEIINDYWDSVWLQDPANPEDRWKSDWIRALLIAYSVEGSNPAKLKNSSSYKRTRREVDGYSSRADQFVISDEWNHIPINILNAIILNLGLKKIKFYGYTVFSRWIESPCTIESIELSTPWEERNKVIYPEDLFIKIEDNIKIEIKELIIGISDIEKYFKIRKSLFYRFINIEIINISVKLEGNQFIDFSNNTNIKQLELNVTQKENETINVIGINSCKLIEKVLISGNRYAGKNIIVEDFNLQYHNNLNSIYFRGAKLIKPFTGQFNGTEITILNSELEEIINIEYAKKYVSQYQWSNRGNKFILDNVSKVKEIFLKGFLSNIQLNTLSELNCINIESVDTLYKIELLNIQTFLNKNIIKAESIGQIDIKNCTGETLPFVESKIIFQNKEITGTTITVNKHEIKTIDGIERIKGINKIHLIELSCFEDFFNSHDTKINIIKAIKVESSSIAQIKNINCFVDIVTVELNDLNNLKSIEGIENLQKLETLDLSGCKTISSLEPLLELNNLKSLKLSSCDSLKPKPKKVLLTGIDLNDELIRHNKDKTKKLKVDTKYFDKIILLLDAFNIEGILQVCTLIDSCNESSLEKLFYGVSYDPKEKIITLPSLPKSMQKSVNKITILALKLIVASKKKINLSAITNLIEQLSINNSKSDQELNKVSIFDYDFFNALFNDLSELKELEKLTAISADSLPLLELKGINMLPNLKYAYFSNIKSFSNINDLLAAYSLNELSISGTEESIIDFSNSKLHLSKLTLGGHFTSLINYNNLSSLEELFIQSLERINLAFSENLNCLKKLKLAGSFGKVEGLDKLTSLESLFLPLAKIEDSESTMKSLLSKKISSYNLGTFNFSN